jgi:hypothetical protein
MSDRLTQMERRNLNNLWLVGGALVAAWPMAWLALPYGAVLGAAPAALGVNTLLRARRLGRHTS